MSGSMSAAAVVLDRFKVKTLSSHVNPKIDYQIAY